MAKLKISQKDYEKMLLTLEKKGRSGFGDLAHGVLVVLGAASAAFAAPTLAAATGVTTITGVTWLASLVGWTAVSATPVGWVAGCAAAGGAVVYGVGKLVRIGGRHDEKRRMMREKIEEKIQACKDSAYRTSDDEQFKNVIYILRLANYQNKISSENGLKIIAALNTQHLTPEQALDMCEGLTTGKFAVLERVK